MVVERVLSLLGGVVPHEIEDTHLLIARCSGITANGRDAAYVIGCYPRIGKHVAGIEHVHGLCGRNGGLSRHLHITDLNCFFHMVRPNTRVSRSGHRLLKRLGDVGSVTSLQIKFQLIIANHQLCQGSLGAVFIVIHGDHVGNGIVLHDQRNALGKVYGALHHSAAWPFSRAQTDLLVLHQNPHARGFMVGCTARTGQAQAKVCGIVIRLVGCRGEQLELILGNHVLIELDTDIEVGYRVGGQRDDLALASSLTNRKYHTAIRGRVFVFLRDHLFDLGHALLFKAKLGRVSKRSLLRLVAIDLFCRGCLRFLLTVGLSALLDFPAGKAAKQHGDA